MSIANTGKKQSKETLAKLSIIRKGKTPWNKGIPNPKRSGDKHHNWRGGITPVNELLRRTLEYKQWRTAVFERDAYTCKVCRLKGRLHAHHIRPFADCPKLRTDINNGITLCKRCHRFLHRDGHLYWLWDGPFDTFIKQLWVQEQTT